MKYRVATTWVSLLAFLLSACATTGQPRRAGGAAPGPQSRAACIASYTVAAGIGGAIVGGIFATLTNKKKAGSAVLTGAAAGAALGFAYAWGKCLASFSEVKSASAKDYGAASKEIGYTPDQGLVVSIKDYSLSPGAVEPGGEIQFRANYYVMDAPDRADIEVTETRIVQVWNPEQKAFEELGSVDEKVTIAPGMRTANGHFATPDKLESGRYKVGFEVSVARRTGGVEKATEWMTFEITTDRVKLAKAEQESRQYSSSAQGSSGRRSSSANIQTASTSERGAKGGEPETRKMLRVTCSSSLNVREMPGTTNKIVGKVSNGDVYPILEDRLANDGRWYRIEFSNGKDGWVSGTYTRIEE